MNSIAFKKYIWLFAITVTFSTVTPVTVSAQDTVLISNSVQSSNQTGGVTSHGADGKSGKDGLSGKDGANGGSAGVSVTNTYSNDGESSVHIESVVNGVQTLDVQKQPTSSTQQVEATERIAVVQTSTSTETSGSSSVAKQRTSLLKGLGNAFGSFQLIIFTYVTNLF